MLSLLRTAADLGTLSQRNLSPPLAPSKTLIRFLDQVASSYGAPILDAPCGFGRNALPLADKGFNVITVDKDLVRLNSLRKSISEKTHAVGKVFPLCADLTKGRLPFGPSSFSAILCIHYPVQNILADFDDQLMDGGHLFIETFGGHGENYLELPKADEIRQGLRGYKLLFYDERSVGPTSQNAVVVKALAQKCCAARY
jgi:SAM-dependent methyltransferase